MFPESVKCCEMNSQFHYIHVYRFIVYLKLDTKKLMVYVEWIVNMFMISVCATAVVVY